MEVEESSAAISPTVSKVIDECVAEMRDDSEIDTVVIERFEKLLRQGTVPKPEELIEALVGSPSGGKP